MNIHLVSIVKERYGEDAAARLIRLRGGGQVYIPRPVNLRLSHWLVHAVGLENARDLCRHYGGRRFYIQSSHLMDVREMVEHGQTVDEIAISKGVTGRTVQRWIRRWRGFSGHDFGPQRGAASGRVMNDAPNVHHLPVAPQNIDAERSVLGAVLISGDQIERVMGIVSVGDFYRHAHRLIFQSMLALHERRTKIDLLTMKDLLERSGDLEEIGGMNYLAEIADETPHSLNADSYAQIVRDCAVLRHLLKSSESIQRAVYEREGESADEIMSRVQQMIFDLGKEHDRNAALIPIGDSAVAAFERIERLYTDPQCGGITGVPSGFADLDGLTAGFQRSDLVIIAGRPSMGKTALAMNIAENAAIREKLRVAVFSLEMPALHLAMRSLSSLSGIDSSALHRGELGEGSEGEANWKRLAGALDVPS